ncbi:MAG TPA: hypothetical protein VG142_11935 [Trebonia sp.]|jgi:hypothetical protein|nr:hypothetical protein [Trebonia sp.]
MTINQDEALHVHTTEEAAVILKCEAGWLHEQARQKKIPHAELSGRCCFTSAHLSAIIAAHEVLPLAPDTSPGPELAHTAEKAASIIGGTCKGSWLKQQARARIIPHTRIGGACHFTDDQLRDVLAICEVPPRAEAKPGSAAHDRHSTAPAAASGQGETVLRARSPRSRRVRPGRDDDGGETGPYPRGASVAANPLDRQSP